LRHACIAHASTAPGILESMMKFHKTTCALAVALIGATPAHAQTTGARPVPVPGESTLSPVVVTGNPLGAELFDLTSPVSVLGGQDLFLQRRSTIATLADLPASRHRFRPNASRPVIRGWTATASACCRTARASWMRRH
jgi:iron complex outermembrane receptor protein